MSHINHTVRPIKVKLEKPGVDLRTGESVPAEVPMLPMLPMFVNYFDRKSAGTVPSKL